MSISGAWHPPILSMLYSLLCLIRPRNSQYPGSSSSKGHGLALCTETSISKRFQSTKYVEGTDRVVNMNTHSVGFMAVWIFVLVDYMFCCVPEVVIYGVGTRNAWWCKCLWNTYLSRCCSLMLLYDGKSGTLWVHCAIHMEMQCHFVFQTPLPFSNGKFQCVSKHRQ